MKTTPQILEELKALGCPLSLRQYERLRRKLGIASIGNVRTCPLYFPEDTAARIAESRGVRVATFGSNVPVAVLPSMPQLLAIKRASKKGGRK